MYLTLTDYRMFFRPTLPHSSSCLCAEVLSQATNQTTWWCMQIHMSSKTVICKESVVQCVAHLPILDLPPHPLTHQQQTPLRSPTKPPTTNRWANTWTTHICPQTWYANVVARVCPLWCSWRVVEQPYCQHITRSDHVLDWNEGCWSSLSSNGTWLSLYTW